MRSKINLPYYKTWIEISKSSLIYNLKQFRKIVGGRSKVACVIKANAYGHDLLSVTEILKKEADWFCVDNLDEGLNVRTITQKPILILGYIPLIRLREAIENNLSFVVYNWETLKKIKKIKLPLKAKIHLKIETGLNRQGVTLNQLIPITRFIKNNKSSMFLQGVSTHFANIEDTLEPNFANSQLKILKQAITILKNNGFTSPLIHCAASAGTMLYSKTHFNMVRVGIGLYGLWPSSEIQASLKIKKGRIMLKPVLTWKSIVAQIKELKIGESVGYGRTWFANKKTKIAIIPIGYSDGYNRNLSNKSRVLIDGKSAPVIGRIAMNMIVVDITEINDVSIESQVVLIGKDGKGVISTDELAFKSGTINYEVVSRINSNIPRVIVK